VAVFIHGNDGSNDAVNLLVLLLLLHHALVLVVVSIDYSASNLPAQATVASVNHLALHDSHLKLFRWAIHSGDVLRHGGHDNAVGFKLTDDVGRKSRVVADAPDVVLGALLYDVVLHDAVVRHVAWCDRDVALALKGHVVDACA
jgi:hypothetical protein